MSRRQPPLQRRSHIRFDHSGRTVEPSTEKEKEYPQIPPTRKGNAAKGIKTRRNKTNQRSRVFDTSTSDETFAFLAQNNNNYNNSNEPSDSLGTLGGPSRQGKPVNIPERTKTRFEETSQRQFPTQKTTRKAKNNKKRARPQKENPLDEAARLQYGTPITRKDGYPVPANAVDRGMEARRRRAKTRHEADDECQVVPRPVSALDGPVPRKTRLSAESASLSSSTRTADNGDGGDDDDDDDDDEMSIPIAKSQPPPPKGRARRRPPKLKSTTARGSAECTEQNSDPIDLCQESDDDDDKDKKPVANIAAVAAEPKRRGARMKTTPRRNERRNETGSSNDDAVSGADALAMVNSIQNEMYEEPTQVPSAFTFTRAPVGNRGRISSDSKGTTTDAETSNVVDTTPKKDISKGSKKETETCDLTDTPSKESLTSRAFGAVRNGWKRLTGSAEKTSSAIPKRKLSVVEKYESESRAAKSKRSKKAKAIKIGASLEYKTNSWSSPNNDTISRTTRSQSRSEGKENGVTAARSRRKSPGAGSNDVICLDDSDDDEADGDKSSGAVVHEAVRIAIGSKVFEQNCKVKLKGDGVMELSYKTEKDELVCHTIDFSRGDVVEAKYFATADTSADAQLAENNKNATSGNTEEAFELATFIAMKVDKTDQNNLKKYSNAYRPDGKSDEKRFVVIELRTDEDCELLLHSIQTYPQISVFFGEESKLDIASVEKYSASLILFAKTMAKRARRVGSAVREGFLKGRKDDDLLLTYPFPAEKAEFDAAAHGLRELSGAPRGETTGTGSDDEFSAWNTKATASQTKEDTESKGRGHYLEIRVEDFDRLEPGEFLNDTLIDFFMKWMTRNDTSGTVHVFTTHFFSTLEREGPSSVKKWTMRKGIDIFKLKFVIIPINKNLHWSICVVVNPGSILELIGRQNGSVSSDDEVEKPCLLFFDSLKCHQMGTVRKHVIKWLNAEWDRLGKNRDFSNPFQKRSFNILAPRIPYQDNTWDCGVFVCRYAYGLYQLRFRKFSFAELEITGRTKSIRMISEGPEFDFGMNDIARIREEMKVLIIRLAEIYLPRLEQSKREEIKARTDARLAQNGGKVSQPDSSQDSVAVTLVVPASETKRLESPPLSKVVDSSASLGLVESFPTGSHDPEEPEHGSNGTAPCENFSEADKPRIKRADETADIDHPGQVTFSQHMTSLQTNSVDGPWLAHDADDPPLGYGPTRSPCDATGRTKHPGAPSELARYSQGSRRLDPLEEETLTQKLESCHVGSGLLNPPDGEESGPEFGPEGQTEVADDDIQTLGEDSSTSSSSSARTARFDQSWKKITHDGASIISHKQGEPHCFGSPPRKLGVCTTLDCDNI